MTEETVKSRNMPLVSEDGGETKIDLFLIGIYFFILYHYSTDKPNRHVACRFDEISSET